MNATANGGTPHAPLPPTPVHPSSGSDSQPVVLTGDWKRVNSSFAVLDGMVVRIRNNGRQGVIVFAPSNPNQFQMGDLKWRNITRVSARRFSFDDLVRQSGSGAMSYVPGFIEVKPNGTELRLSFPTTGTFQQWQRE